MAIQQPSHPGQVASFTKRPLAPTFSEKVIEAVAALFLPYQEYGYTVGLDRSQYLTSQNSIMFIFSARLFGECQVLTRSTFTDTWIVNKSPQEAVDDAAKEIFNKLMQALHYDTHDKYGDYPDVRIWATKHLRTAAFRFTKGYPLPGWVWPHWNKAFPEAKAVKTGGITLKGEAMATPKIVRGAVPKRQVQTPKCPKHEKDMVLDTDENIWRCRERDGSKACNIIFRPKIEHVAGTTLIGKGKVSFKVVHQAGGRVQKIFLVSDDNVALDITNQITDIQINQDSSGAPLGVMSEIKVTFSYTGYVVVTEGVAVTNG